MVPYKVHLLAGEDVVQLWITSFKSKRPAMEDYPRFQLLFSASQIGGGRGVNKDDAGLDSTYVRWKEYQQEINLTAPFQMGFLAGATMSKGVSVDVPDPSWAKCHECHNPSNECFRGTWWCSPSACGQTQQPAWVKFCCTKEISGLFACFE